MADRFPSIEDIDAGEGSFASAASAAVTVTDVQAGETDVRPDNSGGDFLERERAALGDDADLFASSHDQRAPHVEEGDDDLLGGDDDFSAPAQPASSKDDDIDGFESSFPAIDTRNDAVGPGGAVTSTTSGYTNYQPPVLEEETPPIRQWREKRDADIARRDEASNAKKQETVSTAQKDIDSFYESYNRKVDRQKGQVQKEAEEFLAKREDTTAGGTSWERIAKLVDLSGKGQIGGGEGSSKKRMRELLLSLKADKEAPGAGGV